MHASLLSRLIKTFRSSRSDISPPKSISSRGNHFKRLGLYFNLSFFCGGVPIRWDRADQKFKYSKYHPGAKIFAILNTTVCCLVIPELKKSVSHLEEGNEHGAAELMQSFFIMMVTSISAIFMANAAQCGEQMTMVLNSFNSNELLYQDLESEKKWIHAKWESRICKWFVPIFQARMTLLVFSTIFSRKRELLWFENIFPESRLFIFGIRFTMAFAMLIGFNSAYLTVIYVAIYLFRHAYWMKKIRCETDDFEYRISTYHKMEVLNIAFDDSRSSISYPGGVFILSLSAIFFSFGSIKLYGRLSLGSYIKFPITSIGAYVVMVKLLAGYATCWENSSQAVDSIISSSNANGKCSQLHKKVLRSIRIFGFEMAPFRAVKVDRVLDYNDYVVNQICSLLISYK